MVIGITGGVGCGKSTVLDILYKEYNAYIIDADIVAHRLMEPGSEVYKAEVLRFGKGILAEDGTIDRKALGQLVFNDRESLKELNAIVHPAVKKAILKSIEDKRNEYKYIAVEAALFIEAGYMDICDELWYIYADPETRAERIIKTRGYTVQRAQAIMANQLKDTDYRKHSSFVIDNSKDICSTRAQIAKRLEIFKEEKKYGREKNIS